MAVAGLVRGAGVIVNRVLDIPNNPVVRRIGSLAFNTLLVGGTLFVSGSIIREMHPEEFAKISASVLQIVGILTGGLGFTHLFGGIEKSNKPKMVLGGVMGGLGVAILASV